VDRDTKGKFWEVTGARVCGGRGAPMVAEVGLRFDEDEKREWTFRIAGGRARELRMLAVKSRGWDGIGCKGVVSMSARSPKWGASPTPRAPYKKIK
jgi:hypothetical protein